MSLSQLGDIGLKAAAEGVAGFEKPSRSTVGRAGCGGGVAQCRGAGGCSLLFPDALPAQVVELSISWQ